MAKAASGSDVPRVEGRRNHGARAIAGLLAPVVRPVLARRAPAMVALLTDWTALAGAELAARAAPVKLAAGTLTLACTGPAAMELQYRAPDIIARLNLGLGGHAVERLRFVARPPDLGTPIVTSASPAPPPPPPPKLPEGPLGEALARLYQGIASRLK